MPTAPAGLQYVWEYRSPSKSVPPHYHCKLCGVSRLQHDMLAHVKGWKHSFRYMVSMFFLINFFFKLIYNIYL